jgi:3-oxoisoapionate decarboxylase
MKLGLESYTTRNSGLDPVGVLGLAAELGLSGVLFELTPFESFRDDYLAKIRHAAEEKRLYIEFGMGSLVHWHPMAEKGRQLLAQAGYDISGGDGQVAIHHLRVAQKLGSPLLRVVAGNVFTRDEGHDMVALADQAVAVLRELCPVAEDLGMKIAMETHADFTVRELASIIARVASPAMGVTVDCANVAFDLDSPLRLAEILAPYAVTTHFKNYRVIRTCEGLALENCPLGEGDIDIAAMARLLAEHNPAINLNIELHTQFAPFKLNILDPAFWTRHPAPPGDGLGWFLAKAWNRPMLDPWPESLPDGPKAWERESEHLRLAVQWTKQALAGHLTT